MKYYEMFYESICGDFIRLDREAFDDISAACLASEFQFISRKPVSVVTSENSGGTVFPDFYYAAGVPLFSEKMYGELKKFGSDGCFVKKVKITGKFDGAEHLYFMALPPRIDALDWEKSKYTVENDDPLINFKEVSRYVFAPEKIGRYDIFKLADVVDSRIFVSQKLKERFESREFMGAAFFEEGEYSENVLFD